MISEVLISGVQYVVPTVEPSSLGRQHLMDFYNVIVLYIHIDVYSYVVLYLYKFLF